MKAVIRRLNRLEDALGATGTRAVLRLVVSSLGVEADLRRATCKRYVCANGTSMELVDLKGCGNTIGGEELDQFIESFPITYARGQA